MRIISIVNQKGGCGKTTTAINLGAVFADLGHRTLIVDLDSQSHCAAGLGVPEDRLEYSIGDAMRENLALPLDHDRLVREVARNLYLAPSTMQLAMLEAPGGGLHALPDRDDRLRQVLEHLDGRYDVVLVDCSPTIGILTFNAFRASREVIIPVECGYFSLKGSARQWQTIQRLIQRYNRPIACHLLPTFYNPDSGLTKDILRALKRDFAGHLLPMTISVQEDLREAASMGQSVVEYAPGSTAHREYEALARWLIAHPVTFAAGPEEGQPTAMIESADPLIGKDGPAGPSSLSSSRAVELVNRIRQEALEASRARTAGTTKTVSGTTATTQPYASSIGCQDFGVQIHDQDVRFVQPPHPEGACCIAGDFNHWSPVATPLMINADRGVAETVIQLPPGCYHYQLVVGGKWCVDPNNPHQVTNSKGETTSTFTVPGRPESHA